MTDFGNTDLHCQAGAPWHMPPLMLPPGCFWCCCHHHCHPGLYNLSGSFLRCRHPDHSQTTPASATLPPPLLQSPPPAITSPPQPSSPPSKVPLPPSPHSSSPLPPSPPLPLTLSCTPIAHGPRLHQSSPLPLAINSPGFVVQFQAQSRKMGLDLRRHLSMFSRDTA